MWWIVYNGYHKEIWIRSRYFKKRSFLIDVFRKDSTETDLQVYFVIKINSMGSWLDNTGTLSIILEYVQTF